MSSLLTLSFYGVGVAVESDPALIAAVEHDFSWFAAEVTQPRLVITRRRERPDWDHLPEMTAVLATPRNICFRHGRSTFIDYFGRALAVWDPGAGRVEVVTEDDDLAREIVYLTILSRVSEALDRRGLHRIHALGVEHRRRGYLVLLPAGGGKSTLALGLLRRPGSAIRLLSEDSPLLDGRGMLHPFPLRIGVHPHSLPPGIDPAYTREERRMEFDPKVSITIRCFASRVAEGPVPAAAALLGIRTTGKTPAIRRVPRWRLARHTLMHSVIGIGLYQGMEFILQRGLRDVAAHGVLALARVRGSLALARRARVFEFMIGRDPAANGEALARFIEDDAGG